jgi:hypothetical protein
MERSKPVIYQRSGDTGSQNEDILDALKISDSSSRLEAEKTRTPVKYQVNPIHLAAHRDYQKWVKLPEPYREKYGIVGDPLCHFIRLHEEKAKSKFNR